jgi:hypothetical protein
MLPDLLAKSDSTAYRHSCWESGNRAFSVPSGMSGARGWPNWLLNRCLISIRVQSRARGGTATSDGNLQAGNLTGWNSGSASSRTLALLPDLKWRCARCWQGDRFIIRVHYAFDGGESVAHCCGE